MNLDGAFKFGQVKKTALCLSVLALGALMPGQAAQASEARPYVGNMQTYVARYEDTLLEIARKFNLGFNEIRSANPFVDAWMPEPGTELVIPTRHILPPGPRDGIVINLPEMRLYAYVRGKPEPVTHPIGIGREGLETPVGRTTVTAKREGPTWRPTPRMRAEDPTLPAEVPPGPDNPLGTHALYLGWPAYAIHGTNKPYGIGRRVSSGCIRLYPERIIELYPLISPGTNVHVIDQPIKAAWIGNSFYLEAHAPLDQAREIEEMGGFPKMDLTDDDLKVILNAAGEDADLLDWAAIRSVVLSRQGYPVRVADRSERRAALDAGDTGSEDAANPI